MLLLGLYQVLMGMSVYTYMHGVCVPCFYSQPSYELLRKLYRTAHVPMYPPAGSQVVWDAVFRFRHCT